MIEIELIRVLPLDSGRCRVLEPMRRLKVMSLSEIGMKVGMGNRVELGKR